MHLVQQTISDEECVKCYVDLAFCPSVYTGRKKSKSC
jgi:hypothetical protein